MAKKARPAAGSPNAGKLNLDRVGTLATAIVDLMPKLLDQADWAVERGAEFRVSEPSRVDSMMNRTRKLLEALADLLTKAVPLERERMVQRPYQTEYGTRLEFREPSPSETKYQPGNWTESDRKPVRPLLSGQYPSVMDELLEEQALRPVVSWLYSARRAVLAYAADFWFAFGIWPKLAVPTDGFAGWPLDMPAGQRLAVRNDIFRNADSWLGWGRCAADFPRLINDAAVKEWIARESPMAAGGAAAELGPAKKYLTSWREILVALGMKNNNEDREKVRNLNHRYDGPIVIPRQARNPRSIKTS